MAADDVLSNLPRERPGRRSPKRASGSAETACDSKRRNRTAERRTRAASPPRSAGGDGATVVELLGRAAVASVEIAVGVARAVGGRLLGGSRKG